MSDSLRTEALVVGAGVCGLLVAGKLARLGLRVHLVDSAPFVARGSSSRNEGWLHRGTYHASAITDRPAAIRVARQCIYGHEQIRLLAPEAVQTLERPAVALVRDPERCRETEDRWSEAGVQFSPITLATLRGMLPQLDDRLVYRAFSVSDLGVDTRILYRRLLTDCVRAGVQVALEHAFLFAPREGAVLKRRDGRQIKVRAENTVIAAGPWSSDIIRGSGIDLPVRFWKSHLLYGPQVSDGPMFWLDPLEATIINHDPNVSVVGLNEDSYEVARIDYDVDQERANLVRNGLRRMVTTVQPDAFTPVACIKIDVSAAGGPRSVDVSLLELRDGVIFICPGKMTEAPFLADRVVRLVATRTTNAPVAGRPWDFTG